jgi:hypothetical protein
MNRPRRLSPLSLICVLVSGCSGQCSSPAPASAPAAAASAAPLGPVAALEQRLGLTLPDRNTDETLPALAKLPRRRTMGVDLDKQLWLAVGPTGAVTLATGASLTAAEVAQDERLTATLRTVVRDWPRRSGTAAAQLLLIADRGTSGVALGRIRRLALAAHGWRLGLLVRDGDGLAELLLNSPAALRTVPAAAAVPAVPTPATAP